MKGRGATQTNRGSSKKFRELWTSSVTALAERWNNCIGSWFIGAGHVKEKVNLAASSESIQSLNSSQPAWSNQRTRGGFGLMGRRMVLKHFIDRSGSCGTHMF